MFMFIGILCLCFEVFCVYVYMYSMFTFKGIMCLCL